MTSITRSVKLATWTVIILLCLGMVRSIYVAAMRSDLPAMRIGIIQPNLEIISKDDKKRYGQRYIEVLRRGTKELNKLGADLVIWPESAFPYLYDRGFKHEYTPGQPLELKDDGNGLYVSDTLTPPDGKFFIYSNVIMAGEAGRVMGMYNKNQPFAFVDYTPTADEYHHWAKRMRSRPTYWSDMGTGQNSGMLQDGNIQIAPFIYDEGIIEGSANQVALSKPNLLITFAKHALFGDSTAPHHALALATLRSVETRRDLVRATNTGVSSIGDALGRLHNKTPYYEMIGDDLPAPILLVGEVVFMEIFALGPYTTPFFPYACALVLAILIFTRIMRELLGRPQYKINTSL